MNNELISYILSLSETQVEKLTVSLSALKKLGNEYEKEALL